MTVAVNPFEVDSKFYEFVDWLFEAKVGVQIYVWYLKTSDFFCLHKPHLEKKKLVFHHFGFLIIS